MAAQLHEQRFTFYGGDNEGYIDYPSLEAELCYAEFRSKLERNGAQEPPQAKHLDATSTLSPWPTEWAVQRLRAESPDLTERS